MAIRYVCGYALENECYEICQHVFPHGRTYGCDHRPCPHDAASCIPFIGEYPLVKERRAIRTPARRGREAPRRTFSRTRKEE